MIEIVENVCNCYMFLVDCVVCIYVSGVYFLVVFIFVGWVIVLGDICYVLNILIVVLIIICFCVLGLVVFVVFMVVISCLY